MSGIPKNKKSSCSEDLVKRKKMASDLRRTATTAYPCYVPILGDSAGAGRAGLAVANIQSFRILASGDANKYKVRTIISKKIPS